MDGIKRREFVKVTALGAIGVTIGGAHTIRSANEASAQGAPRWSTPNEVVRLEVWLCHRGGLQWRRSTSLKRSLRSCGRLMF